MRGYGRHGSSSIPLPPGSAAAQPRANTDWATLKRLVPYLWEYKWRALAALVFMVGAKLANVGVPMLLRRWWTR